MSHMQNMITILFQFAYYDQLSATKDVYVDRDRPADYVIVQQVVVGRCGRQYIKQDARVTVRGNYEETCFKVLRSGR